MAEGLTRFQSKHDMTQLQASLADARKPLAELKASVTASLAELKKAIKVVKAPPAAGKPGRKSGTQDAKKIVPAVLLRQLTGVALVV